MIFRTYNPRMVEIIVNHPDCRETFHPGEEYLTAYDVCANMDNVLYAFDAGLIMFVAKGDGIYEAHIACIKQGRGKVALEASRFALDRLFADHKARKVIAVVPLQLRGARYLVRTLGFTSVGVGEDAEFFHKEADDGFHK